MFRKILSVLLVLSILLLGACGLSGDRYEGVIRYRYASKSEGTELLLPNTAYYDGFSQNDLDFRMQKKNADMDEYLSFAKEQVLDFSAEEMKLVDKLIRKMEKLLVKSGYTLPPLDEIVFVKTTMYEECDAGGYTHGTDIFLSEYCFDEVLHGEDRETRTGYLYVLKEMLWHELFHCLTRNNPDFKAKMYDLIHFTIADKDFELPPSVFEYHISNPDVEHHDSYATFTIDGKDTECFVDFVTTKHFEEEGDNFFDSSETALVPTDGTDIYYTPDDAENFNEVFGENTEYVVDPEECMADNFAFAMMYGTDGPEGDGYPNPEIIDGILQYLKGEE